jgi:hypothetical protein
MDAKGNKISNFENVLLKFYLNDSHNTGIFYDFTTDLYIYTVMLFLVVLSLFSGNKKNLHKLLDGINAVTVFPLSP